MKHLFYIVSWVMMLFSSIVTFAQTPFDAFSPETSRPILDGDSIAAWRAEQHPDTVFCAIVADLRNEQLLLVDVKSSSVLAYAPFTDEMKNWISVDPLADKYIHQSPYLYCNGNPVMFIDLYGEEPSDDEAAAMAAYAYGDIDLTANNEKSKAINKQLGAWKPIDTDELSITGYRAVLFEREVDGTKEYAYAFAGTDSKSIADIATDIAQAVDLPSQYEMAVIRARFLAIKYLGSELTMVGHSLGGGLATAAAFATGKTAITFNPAAVSCSTIMRNFLLVPAKIENHVVMGDPLTIGQKLGNPLLIGLFRRSGLLILPGKTTMVPQNSENGAHTIYNFIN